MRREHAQHPPRLPPRLFDEPRGEKGAAATEWAALRRVGADDAIASARQNTLGGAGVFRLEIAVEGIDEQHDLAPASGRAPSVGMAGPLGQLSLVAEPEPPLPARGEPRE